MLTFATKHQTQSAAETDGCNYFSSDIQSQIKILDSGHFNSDLMMVPDKKLGDNYS